MEIPAQFEPAQDTAEEDEISEVQPLEEWLKENGFA